MRISILFLLLLSGCATTAGYEKVLSSWVGNSTDHLISTWGQPANTYPLSDGGKVLEYSNQRNIQLGGYTTMIPLTTYQTGTANIYGRNGGYATGNYNGIATTYVPQTAPVQNITMQCVTRFTADSQGIIIKWAWQGNDCKAKEPEQHKIQNTVDFKNKTEKQIEWENMNKQYKVICDKAEFSTLFIKTPCNGNDITITYLVDTTIATKEQRVVFLKWREDMDVLNNELRTFLQNSGSSSDKQLADYLVSFQSEIDKYNMDLYNGLITWGDYNKARKDFNAKTIAKRKSLYPQTK